MQVIKMTDLDLKGKRVLIREDLNVPQNDDGSIADDTRIRASLPTIKHAMNAGARVMLMSHLGRPKEGPTEGRYTDKDSLRPVAEHLGKLLGREVRLYQDWLGNGKPYVQQMRDGEVAVLENVRFNIGENNNEDRLSWEMAQLCDVYVMDAFGTAHRAQSSTHGVAKFAPIAAAGILLAAELDVQPVRRLPLSVVAKFQPSLQS